MPLPRLDGLFFHKSLSVALNPLFQSESEGIRGGSPESKPINARATKLSDAAIWLARNMHALCSIKP